MWFKRNGVGSSTEKLISKSFSSTNAGYALHIYDDGTICLRVRTGVTLCDIYSNTVFDDLNWHHVVAIWDQGSQYLYIDWALDKNLDHGNLVIEDDHKALEIGIHYGWR